jgi:hypothetical protein
MSDLTEIAAQILSGLLASGDYTLKTSSGSGYDYPASRTRCRPEAVVDAIELAQRLQTLCEKQGQVAPDKQAPVTT